MIGIIYRKSPTKRFPLVEIDEIRVSTDVASKLSAPFFKNTPPQAVRPAPTVTSRKTEVLMLLVHLVSVTRFALPTLSPISVRCPFSGRSAETKYYGRQCRQPAVERVCGRSPGTSRRQIGGAHF